MRIKRLWGIICSCFIRGGGRRADYARKKGIYAHVGNKCSFQPRLIPVYSELISFGDNVRVARNVDFVTHDVIHLMLNRMPQKPWGDHRFMEQIGCIEIGDNVVIGGNSVVLFGVRIGSNTIIGSGSVVTKDCEPNSIYAGVPAKRIGSLDNYIQRRIAGECHGRISLTMHNQQLTQEEIRNAWDTFHRNHGE